MSSLAANRNLLYILRVRPKKRHDVTVSSQSFLAAKRRRHSVDRGCLEKDCTCLIGGELNDLATQYRLTQNPGYGQVRVLLIKHVLTVRTGIGHEDMKLEPHWHPTISSRVPVRGSTSMSSFPDSCPIAHVLEPNCACPVFHTLGLQT